MADVVVVGAGLGGLAAAARLAKQGHTVTVLERNASVGGSLRRVEQDGFGWDAGASTTTLPAVLRDLFRKSGRPIERYVELVLRSPARRHVFEDGSVVDLPTGSRGAQISAVDTGLGTGSGLAWARFVDAQGPVWDTLRRSVLDLPDGGARLADDDVARALSARTSLASLVKKSLKDERLRAVADHGVRLAGSDPRNVPGYVAVDSYLERAFGVWEVRDGLMAQLVDALAVRLAERGVTLQLAAEVSSVHVAGRRVCGVGLVDGPDKTADAVITDVDPRTVLGSWLPAELDLPARRLFAAATPAIPVTVTHLGLRGDVAALPAEVVLHGEPLVVVTTHGTAPHGDHAWTIQLRGSAREDVLITMMRRGIDVRDQVVTRVDRSPADLLEETSGSSYGIAWSGWREYARRAAHTNPLPGLYLLGASMHPGATIPYVAWGAAHVAAQVGKAQ